MAPAALRCHDRPVTYGLADNASAGGVPEVGAIVRLPAAPDWGLGQVQSIVGTRITVNFENRGKVVLQGDSVALELVAPDTG